MPILPTLSNMAGVYRLSREGGAKSPRFAEYVRLGRDGWALPLYNPMAGPAALEAVEELIRMDAESMAAEELAAMQERFADDEEVTLAIVLASKGMWTDRLATEAEYRTKADRDPKRGVIYLWSREVTTEVDVRRESAAEAVRVLWTLRHGQATSMYQVLVREGLAYAPLLNPHAPSHGPNTATEEVLAILGDSGNHGEIVAALYGDAAAEELGFAPLGLEDRAGFRWAPNHMNGIIAERGLAAATDYRLTLPE